ncbi:NAD-dependent succinate-semialdehyde dehydrogenase [Mesorhizobium sp. AR02]|uniref:NAD-dependent succinate-semialdehyde dehydrogenase n=1 Tax=Mesorhizobium sp. AR02 TaxID=2865837 RepID=UPI0021604A96|nr:NAD-dependent succinate-semialdehyde dehydrogenase [Mesorhizobium sp. AR02]UVK54574.1 NAD-dependent succinate-semialdehyde dehydrogenase [Mesorhizobium sp. AR02]
MRDIQLFVDGVWRAGSSGASAPVLDPATGDIIGTVALAAVRDLEEAASAASRTFSAWRKVSALDRCQIMRSAAALMRSRAEQIAALITNEQGKSIQEALSEVRNAADVVEWFADEGRRVFGWTIPPRVPGSTAVASREPIGPVAGFTPWNYPVGQAARKIAAALAAGCTIVLKAAEETPASTAELVRCFDEAGVPAGALNLVFGIPAEVSGHLIPHPSIRAVTFTGSTSIGKRLTALAGLHMKSCTMELGGHAPCLVFKDADIDNAVEVLGSNKFHNAGQSCIAPTRILVESSVYDDFLTRFTAYASTVRMGAGIDPQSMMGPLAHSRRPDVVDALVQDAIQCGAKLVHGGRRSGNHGYFYEPTVLAEVPAEARIMNEEPFGPVAILNRFRTVDEAIDEANRLNCGLAAYAFSRSSTTIQRLSTEIETGMISINHYGLAYAELPFNGIKDSGFGSEGGYEALSEFLTTRFVATLAH